jgi:ribonuclease HII
MDLERRARARGARLVAGVDEVGRGALGGPVVAAAVVLDPGDPCVAAVLAGVRDSKLLDPVQRTALEPLIRSAARAVAVGRADAVEIDAIGIRGATEVAMLRALAHLPGRADLVLVDGFPIRLWRGAQQAIVHGDRLVLSIAAASIVAKVFRDAEMIALGARQPDYGWDEHKGYGAPAHLRAVETHGATVWHRLTWAPLRAVVAGDWVAPAVAPWLGRAARYGRSGRPARTGNGTSRAQPTLPGWELDGGAG